MLHFPNYMLSQELNNHAGSLIEKGCYDEAISHLAKAMKLTRDCVCASTDDEESTSSCCRCEDCSLEACVQYSTERAAERNVVEEEQTLTGYLHRQPIMIQPSCLQFGHSLGPILPLMLTFNFGLAHHFKAMKETKDLEARRKNMTKACKLYKLSYRVHEQQLDCEEESVWFVMMVANNLGKVHQTLNNDKEHAECMETLMSTIMFFIDCHEPLVDTLDFEGFVGNASHLLMLPCVCAEAA
jgi:hypothetical protein